MCIPIHVIGEHDQGEQARFSPSYGRVTYPISGRLFSFTKELQGFGTVTASLWHILGCAEGVLQNRQNTR